VAPHKSNQDGFALPLRNLLFMEGAGTMTPSSQVKPDASPGNPSASATQALRLSPLPALRRLSVKESTAWVIISGSVSSYYLKQLAQETVMPALDHRELRNQVSVVRCGPA
jgi:hypothetical protein